MAEVRRRPPLVPLAVGAVLVLAIAGAYMYLRAPAADPAGAPAAAVEPSKRDQSAERGEEIVLPPLDETDALVRDLVGKLSSYPVIAAWLTTDGLILNFAAVTSRVANRDDVAQELRAIGPVPPFRPRVSRDRLFLDPSSYKRYDRYSAAMSSIDSRGAARLYATLKPRILDASRRIDPTAPEFDSVMERALVDLLRVPIVEGEIELVPHGIVVRIRGPAPGRAVARAEAPAAHGSAERSGDPGETPGDSGLSRDSRFEASPCFALVTRREEIRHDPIRRRLRRGLDGTGVPPLGARFSLAKRSSKTAAAPVTALTATAANTRAPSPARLRTWKMRS